MFEDGYVERTDKECRWLWVVGTGVDWWSAVGLLKEEIATFAAFIKWLDCMREADKSKRKIRKPQRE